LIIFDNAALCVAYQGVINASTAAFLLFSGRKLGKNGFVHD